MKLGQTSSTTDTRFASKTDQNGAVSNEGARAANVNIPKETGPLKSSQEFTVENVK